MQASRSLATSSLSKLVAWKPSLSGSLSGPVLQHSELTRQQVSGGPCHDYLLTYPSFCCGCKCFAAGRSDEGLLTELFSIGRRHTFLQFSVNVTSKGLSLQHCLFSDLNKQYLDLESAFLATLIDPNGSLDFLSTISCSRSSKRITHLGIGCITESKHSCHTKPASMYKSREVIDHHVIIMT